MTEVFQHAKSIIAKLSKHGHIAYFAGGWVRDFLMGHPCEDIDIATSASPDEIMDLFPNTLLVGLAFGVVVVVLEGHSFEVATFRKDLDYRDGRRPLGVERASPREDALRRDFTINGLFYDPLTETLYDFVQGRADIEKGVIRTIGDPHERFFEDRLRMIRSFRFAARFGFNIDQETQEAIVEHGPQLFPSVAPERIWLEFNKMSAYPGFGEALCEMHRLKLLAVIFPELASVHLKDLRESVKYFPLFPPSCPTILSLMELFSFLTEAEKIEIAKRLKCTKKDIKWIEYSQRAENVVQKEQETGHFDRCQWTALFAHDEWRLALSPLVFRYGKEAASLLFARYERFYDLLVAHIERKKNKTPLVCAEMLLKKGILPGKEMGALLEKAEQTAIEGDLNDPREVLAAINLSVS